MTTVTAIILLCGYPDTSLVQLIPVAYSQVTPKPLPHRVGTAVPRSLPSCLSCPSYPPTTQQKLFWGFSSGQTGPQPELTSGDKELMALPAATPNPGGGKKMRVPNI